MAPSQDMFNIVDNLPTTLIFLGGNCWFEGHYTFPLMATMISVMSESLCGGNPAQLKPNNSIELAHLIDLPIAHLIRTTGNLWKIIFPDLGRSGVLFVALTWGTFQIYPPWIWGAVAILALLMQLCLTIRLYVVSQPANSSAGATHTARETGERMFNQSASCESILDW